MSETPDQPLTDDDIQTERTTDASGITDADSTDAPGQGTGEEHDPGSEGRDSAGSHNLDADSSDSESGGSSSEGDSVDSDSSDQS